MQLHIGKPWSLMVRLDWLERVGAEVHFALEDGVCAIKREEQELSIRWVPANQLDTLWKKEELPNAQTRPK